MSLLRRAFVLLLVTICLINAEPGLAQAGQQGMGFVVVCKEGVAVRANPDNGSALALTSLRSNTTIWKVMRNRSVYAGPVVAGNAVAVIADSYHTVLAFSRKTGRRLWQKDLASSELASDGAHFYLLITGSGNLLSIEPESGHVAWSLKHAGGLLLGVYSGLLFTSEAVVDLSRRRVVHRWRGEPFASSASVNAAGEIVIGDSSGGITVYDRAFHRLRQMSVSGGWVVEAAVTEDGTLGAAYEDEAASNPGAITFLTPAGKAVWELAWSVDKLLLAKPPFTVSGRDVLMIEPGQASRLRLTSRKLATGEMNWTSEDGFFNGPPIVCGETVYADTSDGIRSYDLHSGAEKNLPQRRVTADTPAVSGSGQ